MGKFLFGFTVGIVAWLALLFHGIWRGLGDGRITTEQGGDGEIIQVTIRKHVDPLAF